MKLRDIWNSLKQAMLPPTNTMSNEDFAYVQEKVLRQTGFNVRGEDYTMGNGLAIAGVKKNVGIVFPQGTPQKDIDFANRVFMTAIRIRGNYDMKPDQICFYRARNQQWQPRY